MYIKDNNLQILWQHLWRLSCHLHFEIAHVGCSTNRNVVFNSYWIQWLLLNASFDGISVFYHSEGYMHVIWTRKSNSSRNAEGRCWCSPVSIFLVSFEAWREIYTVKFETPRRVPNAFYFFFLSFNVRLVKCYLIY